MKNTVTLSNFSVLLPPHRIEQGDARQWTLAKHLDSARVDATRSPEELVTLEKVFGRYAVKPELISARYFEFPDLARPLGTPPAEGETEIYPIDANNLSGSTIGHRTRFFSSRALERFRQFYPAERENLEHIVHVTCTGYRSPSAAQLLVAEKGWGESVGITHAYHMGCYASLPAIRLAESLALTNNGRVDVVHNEMCALHMDAAAHTPEQIVVQSLFADGHVKYSITPSSDDTHGLRLLAIKEQVIADSDADMSWIPESWGLRMNLSREVPAKIGTVIHSFFGDLARRAGQDPEVLLRDAIFAVHPGGPKIIDSVQSQLGLTDAQVAASKKILLERGNMSSATLPHVWKEILGTEPKAGTKVVSFAFGPGLTVFGGIFEVV